MKPLTKKEIAEAHKAQEQIFQDRAKDAEEKLPDHQRREYTFTLVEKRRLQELALTKEIIQQSMDDIVNIETLPRLGIDKAYTLYDVRLGRLIVFTPKPTSN